MRLFDLHCDTIEELKNGEKIILTAPPSFP